MNWQQLILFLVIGFLEMFLATQRTYWVSKGKSYLAGILVFFETLLFFFVISQFVQNISEMNWLIILAYALGSALGTFINLEKVPF